MKYENRIELKEDMVEICEDIFKYRPSKANKKINTFLGDLKDHPEVSPPFPFPPRKGEK